MKKMRQQTHGSSKSLPIGTCLTTCLFCPISGVVDDIFRIGSMSPGAVLYDASKEFEVCMHLVSRLKLDGCAPHSGGFHF